MYDDEWRNKSTKNLIENYIEINEYVMISKLIQFLVRPVGSTTVAFLYQRWTSDCSNGRPV